MRPQKELDLKTLILYVARGYSSADIAKAYFVCTGTIESRLHQLYKYCGVNSRVSLVVAALKNGTIKLEDI
jgi:DNA-binding NarL/FixJ family response regulator